MPWFRLDDGFHSHPKVLAAGNDAVGLYVRCGSWSAQHLTDGFVPRHVALLYGTNKLVRRLVDVGLWSADETRDGWAIPDYLDYNPSKEQVEADRSAAAERQRRARDKARESRQQSRRDSRESHTDSHGPPDPTPPVLPTEVPTASAETADVDLVRADVERLCEHLAARIVENGSKRPEITKRWRDAARLLVDRDGRTEDQVHTAIDWCQDHEFWRSNVMSMPKLREQYDKLRLEAQRGNQPGGARSTTDERVAAAQALKARIPATGGGA